MKKHILLVLFIMLFCILFATYAPQNLIFSTIEELPLFYTPVIK